jgi:hypothetical protein
MTDCRPVSLFSIQDQPPAERGTGDRSDKRRFRANVFRTSHPPVAEPLLQPLDQDWIVDRENLTRRRFDIDSKVGGIGEDRVQPGRDALRIS